MHSGHMSPPTSVSHLDWSHVGFGLAFIAFISVVSQLLHLHVGASLAIAALRCIAQLTIMGAVLQHLLVMKNLWIVAGIACMFFPPWSVMVLNRHFLVLLIIISTVEIGACSRLRLAPFSHCHMTNFVK